MMSRFPLTYHTFATPQPFVIINLMSFLKCLTRNRVFLVPITSGMSTCYLLFEEINTPHSGLGILDQRPLEIRTFGLQYTSEITTFVKCKL